MDAPREMRNEIIVTISSANLRQCRVRWRPPQPPQPPQRQHRQSNHKRKKERLSHSKTALPYNNSSNNPEKSSRETATTLFFVVLLCDFLFWVWPFDHDTHINDFVPSLPLFPPSSPASSQFYLRIYFYLSWPHSHHLRYRIFMYV